MIRIAIVEDEAEHAQILIRFLNRYADEHSVSFQISTFTDGLEITEGYTPDYDVLLLDIQMKHMDGMKAAEKIRELDEDVIFIFITSTIQFAVQGYTVDALGYVLKPVPYLAFSQIVSKAVRQLEKRQEISYLQVEVEDGYLRLNIEQIYYLESQRNYVALFTEKGSFRIRSSLKSMEASLDQKGFAKCHNAYLVNLRHVTGILQNVVVLSNETELPVSRAKKKEFLEALTGYLGQ